MGPRALHAAVVAPLLRFMVAPFTYGINMNMLMANMGMGTGMVMVMGMGVTMPSMYVGDGASVVGSTMGGVELGLGFRVWRDFYRHWAIPSVEWRQAP